MKTFHGEHQLKESLIAFTKKNMEHGLYQRGSWLHKKIAYNDLQCGCFYGGMTQTEVNPLGRASEQYGLPLWYVYVTEKIYEGLPEGEWETFPLEAIEALGVGLDLDRARSRFHYLVLENQLRFTEGHPEVGLAIRQCMSLFEGKFPDISESAAESAARAAAAWSAESAVRAAAKASHYSFLKSILFKSLVPEKTEVLTNKVTI